MNILIQKFKPANNIYRIFPIDMLRHDRCWPHTQDTVSVLVILSRLENAENQEIELCKYQVNSKDDFNYDRWISFGWKTVGKSKKIKI